MLTLGWLADLLGPAGRRRICKEMTKILLMRHGHVEGIEPERFRGREPLALTNQGRVEAAAVARRIAAALTPSHIYSSPMGRIVETAELIAAACGIAAVQPCDEWTRQVFVRDAGQGINSRAGPSSPVSHLSSKATRGEQDEKGRDAGTRTRATIPSRARRARPRQRAAKNQRKIGRPDQTAPASQPPSRSVGTRAGRSV
jgi:phosphohistidine phosphatase SixA